MFKFLSPWTILKTKLQERLKIMAKLRCWTINGTASRAWPELLQWMLNNYRAHSRFALHQILFFADPTLDDPPAMTKYAATSCKYCRITTVPNLKNLKLGSYSQLVRNPDALEILLMLPFKPSLSVTGAWSEIYTFKSFGKSSAFLNLNDACIRDFGGFLSTTIHCSPLLNFLIFQEVELHLASRKRARMGGENHTFVFLLALLPVEKPQGNGTAATISRSY
jgi:hypothetical protein